MATAADETISKGMAALAARRWAKATKAERLEQGRKMAAGRAKARRKRGRK